MTCSERRRIAFLAGELPPAEREAFDAHLLECETCWQAVQDDRAGRAALALLHDPAPPGLAERISLGVELAEAGHGGPRRRRDRLAGLPARPRLLVAAAALVILAGLGSLLAALVAGGGPGDPPMVAAVVNLARQPGDARALPRRLDLAGQDVELRSFRVHGTRTLVAISTTPFAMPPASHLVSGSSHRIWMASRGPIGLYCVNAPTGHHSMLAVAAMPAVALPSALAHLGLASA